MFFTCLDLSLMMFLVKSDWLISQIQGISKFWLSVLLFLPDMLQRSARKTWKYPQPLWTSACTINMHTNNYSNWPWLSLSCRYQQVQRGHHRTWDGGRRSAWGSSGQWGAWWPDGRSYPGTQTRTGTQHWQRGCTGTRLSSSTYMQGWECYRMSMHPSGLWATNTQKSASQFLSIVSTQVPWAFQPLNPDN